MKRLALLALVASCAHPTTPTGVVTAGEGRPAPVETTSAPSPAPRLAHRVVRKAASRSRRVTAYHPTETGSHLNSTAYCETGLMANGQHTYRGAVAGNRWPLGTRLHVTDSPYGPGTYTVADRIGHGSELDFAMPGNCDGAREWGRRDVRVEVLR